jgi:hypothetical protein
VNVKLLDNTLELTYDRFLTELPESLFFASNKYRKFLKHFLKAEDAYFVAVDENGKILGALPSFIKENKIHGNILNSLPFYGSNGGLLILPGHAEVGKELLNGFYKFAEEKNCVASTIISSPQDFREVAYEKYSGYTFKDSRIGQLTQLPEKANDINDSVMKIIDSKMRNLIRKAQKLGMTTRWENGTSHFDFLISTHQENMAAIGGLAKEEVFFRMIPDYFEYGVDYRIYTATLNNELTAAMLVFYFNKTVEYFTPVIKAEYRSHQPLSLLIFEAMKDAVQMGYNWWNWGGTWASQGGVYHFKSQWGTSDKPYYYYTKIFNKDILSRTKEELLKEYPYFYVAPFEHINKKVSEELV